jgi:hypothetical protein
MVVDTRRELADTLNAGLADDQAQALRERVAREIPAALASNGLRLSIHHQLASDAAGVGFATATEMAAELGEGAARLFDADLWYPGAALVRQLIECDYLLALMAENREEAAAWMTSSHGEIVARFMPRHMRQRAVRNFRSSEYQTHCDLGGHPNPAGRGLLRHHDEWRPLLPRSHWLDLAQHLAETWSSFVAALPLYDPRMNSDHFLHSPQRSPECGDDVKQLIALWRNVDPVAARGPVPEADA